MRHSEVRDVPFQYRIITVCLVAAVLFGASAAVYRSVQAPATSSSPSVAAKSKPPRQENFFGKRTVYTWGPPPALASQESHESARASNIRRSDYVGPDACRNCHAEELVKRNYPNRGGSAALGWLRHPTSEATRLIGIETLTKSNAVWALADLIDALADSYLINRQFAQQGLERMLDVDLGALGYRYNQLGRESRNPAIDRIRQKFLPQTID